MSLYMYVCVWEEKGRMSMRIYAHMFKQASVLQHNLSVRVSFACLKVQTVSDRMALQRQTDWRTPKRQHRSFI